MEKVFPYSEFHTETFSLQPLRYVKKMSSLSHFITYILQIFYGELQGLTLSVRKSTTFSNKSLLLKIVTWLLHVTRLVTIEHRIDLSLEYQCHLN